MAKQTLEELLSHSAEVFRREQSLENTKDMNSASALLPSPTAASQQRRSEERTDYRHMCTYEIRETIGGESVVIGEGGAFVVNRSKDGILLLMALAPHLNQLIEVHISHSRWRKTRSVFEPRWTKSRQLESHGNLYLVGCRRTVGPCAYWSF